MLQDLYVDYEKADEPMTFFHVFLYSQALECIVLSMVGSVLRSSITPMCQFLPCSLHGLVQ